MSAGKGEAIVIGQIEMDAVEDRQPIGAGGEHRQPERGHQRQAIPGGKGMQVLGQVGGAEHKRG